MMFLRKKLEEVNLHQAVMDKMAELKVDFITLARIAHVRKFGTDPDQNQSWLNYKLHGIVPSFVEEFVRQ